MSNGIGSHQSANMGKDEWLTPRYITNSLGPFDLDPCSPINRPWETAKEYFTIKDDGLWPTWDSWKFVWMNPPYGKHTCDWLEKLSEHGNGIALVFARTETKMFFEHVWSKASCIFFIEGRLTFCHVNGDPGKANGGAPSVLIGYGTKAYSRIQKSGIAGKFINLYHNGARELTTKTTGE